MFTSPLNETDKLSTMRLKYVVPQYGRSFPTEIRWGVLKLTHIYGSECLVSNQATKMVRIFCKRKIKKN